MESTLNNWYNWVLKTNANELIKWYTKVHSKALKNPEIEQIKSKDLVSFLNLKKI